MAGPTKVGQNAELTREVENPTRPNQLRRVSLYELNSGAGTDVNNDALAKIVGDTFDVPPGLEGLAVPRLVCCPCKQLVTALGGVPGERPASPCVSSHWRLPFGLSPARAPVHADLDADDRSPPRPGPPAQDERTRRNESFASFEYPDAGWVEP
jgi:hypothetical protein